MSQQNATIGYLPDEKPTPGKLFLYALQQVIVMKDLRSRIGYVPQKGVLFSGTIESNLRYADQNATDETIQNALEISQAQEFVQKMPEGIEEPIAEGGTNVSGGQKQRLSIARALTKHAQVYIFDDTFSALDYQTDAKLREALNHMHEVLPISGIADDITGGPVDRHGIAPDGKIPVDTAILLSP